MLVKLWPQPADFPRMTTAAETTSLALDPEAQRVIEEQRARRLSRLAVRDRATLVASAAVFLAVAGVMAALISSERSPSALTVVFLVLVYAVTFRFEFEVATGSAVPTQLILVPMLFVLPLLSNLLPGDWGRTVREYFFSNAGGTGNANSNAGGNGNPNAGGNGNGNANSNAGAK